MYFDQRTANSMIGKYVLVGVNHCSKNNTVISTEQIHGRVLRASEEEGLVICLSDGSEFSLPPLLGCYQLAEEGTYTLKNTHEVIESPDYVATFNVTVDQDQD